MVTSSTAITNVAPTKSSLHSVYDCVQQIAGSRRLVTSLVEREAHCANTCMLWD